MPHVVTPPPIWLNFGEKINSKKKSGGTKKIGGTKKKSDKVPDLLEKKLEKKSGVPKKNLTKFYIFWKNIEKKIGGTKKKS